MSHHLGREVDRTIGVKPMVNRFRVLLRLTILKMILWSTCTFSTEKLNQNLQQKSISGSKCGSVVRELQYILQNIVRFSILK